MKKKLYFLFNFLILFFEIENAMVENNDEGAYENEEQQQRYENEGKMKIRNFVLSLKSRL